MQPLVKQAIKLVTFTVRFWSCLLLCVVVSFGTVAGCADIVRPRFPQDISRSFDASDVVCSGKVLRVTVKATAFEERYGQRIRHRTLVMDLNVQRVYKGPPLQSIALEWTIQDIAPANLSGALGVNAGEYVMVFLQQTKEGYVSTANTDHYFSVSPILSRSQASGSELLEADLRAGLQDRENRYAQANLELLMSYPLLTSTAEVAGLIKRSDPSIDAMVFPILLNNRDFSHLREMLDFASRIPDDAVLSFDDSPFLSAISNIRDVNATTFLTDFLRVQNRYFRRSALQALRAIRNERSIPALVNSLNDGDQFVRFQAVKTLAEITGITDATHSPSLPEFEKSGAQYTQNWEDWWRDEGKAKYAPTTGK